MGYKLNWNEKESAGKILCLVICSLIIPPVTVFIRRGCGCQFISSILYFLIVLPFDIMMMAYFGIPWFLYTGPWPLVLHALYLTFTPLRHPPPVILGTPQPQVVVMAPMVATPVTPVYPSPVPGHR